MRTEMYDYPKGRCKVPFIRLGLVLSVLLFVSSPLFADTLVRSGDAFGNDFVVLSDAHTSTFHNYSFHDYGYASSRDDADFDGGNWIHNNTLDDFDGDHDHHWGWENRHKHEHIIGNQGGWDNDGDGGGSKSDPAVPEPSVFVLLVSGLAGLLLVSLLGSDPHFSGPYRMKSNAT